MMDEPAEYLVRYHHGDRVCRWDGDQHGIVEGWKGTQVMVFWGTHDNREFRSWHEGVDLVLANQPGHDVIV